MENRNLSAPLFAVLLMIACNPTTDKVVDGLPATMPFPKEIIEFTPLSENPVFAGTGRDTWDKKIRERGYILKEDDGYHMWYTGYEDYTDSTWLKLGYAHSADGFTWSRHPNNPIFDESWVEDMIVLKHDGTYYMFAEGENDIPKILTSSDKINWINTGIIDVRQTDGSPLSKGPYGTPTVFLEDGTWHLFYERNDQGIWLATSQDMKIWTNVQDDPVITMGPEEYDRYGVAVNQILPYKGYYYAYYHATDQEDWSDWTMNVAVSKDLVHWSKYPKNPIMGDNKSSGFTVYDGEKYRFYTMHPEVVVHFPIE